MPSPITSADFRKPDPLREQIEAAFPMPQMQRDKTDVGKDYAEARMMPIPESVRRKLYEIALRKIPWEKIRDEITVPAIKEMEKGTETLKDSANSYMYRLANPSDKLIDETITDYFRKFGK